MYAYSFIAGWLCRFKQAQENRVWTGKLVEEPYTEYILSLYHAVMVSRYLFMAMRLFIDVINFCSMPGYVHHRHEF